MKDYTNKPRKPMMAGGMAGGMMPKATPQNVDMARARTGMMYGGKTKMAMGGKPMAKDPKTGEMKPTYAMDGKGKMMYGGKAKKK